MVRPLPRPGPPIPGGPEVHFGRLIHDQHTLEIMRLMGRQAVASPAEIAATNAPGLDLSHRSAGEINTAVDELGEHMLDISDDPGGSEVAPYFTPENTAIIMEFVADMDRRGWPKAMPITMEVRRDGRPVWKRGHYDYDRSSLYKGVFYREIGEDDIVGYVFGELGSEKHRQQVAICSDGKLRSLRGPRLRKSYGAGFGVLPRADILLRARDVGLSEGIVHNGRTIRGPSQLKNTLYKKAGVKNPDHAT